MNGESDILQKDSNILQKREEHLSEWKRSNYGINDNVYDNFTRLSYPSGRRQKSSASRLKTENALSDIKAKSFWNISAPSSRSSNLQTESLQARVVRFSARENLDKPTARPSTATSSSGSKSSRTRHSSQSQQIGKHPQIKLTRCAVVQPQLSSLCSDSRRGYKAQELRIHQARQIPEELQIYKTVSWVGKNMFLPKKLSSNSATRAERSCLPLAHLYNPYVPINVLQKSDRQGYAVRGTLEASKETAPAFFLGNHVDKKNWKPTNSYVSKEEGVLNQKRRQKLVKIAETYGSASASNPTMMQTCYLPRSTTNPVQ